MGTQNLKQPITIKLSVVLAVVFLTLGAQAGVGAGGGGTSIVCRDINGNIKSAELLDLYEAKLRGLKLVQDNNLSSNYGRFMSRWIEMNGGTPAPINETQQYNQINEFLVKYSVTTSLGQKLALLGDFSTGPIPLGCEIEQLAVFLDGPTLLVIDREIWDALNQQNRAALLAHEIVYRNDRIVFGFSNSNKARNLVGRFFSTTPIVDDGI